MGAYSIAKDYHQQALKQVEQGQYQDAFAWFDLALKSAPLFVDSYLHRGLLHIKQRDYVAALMDAKRLIYNEEIISKKKFPLKSSCREAAISIYQALATELDAQGEVLDSNKHDLSRLSKEYFGLARYAAQNQHYDNSITFFRKSIALTPLNADAYFELGIVYGLIDEIDLALEKYHRGLSLNQESNRAANYLKGLLDKKLSELDFTEAKQPKKRKRDSIREPEKDTNLQIELLFREEEVSKMTSQGSSPTKEDIKREASSMPPISHHRNSFLREKKQIIPPKKDSDQSLYSRESPQGKII